MPTKPTGRPAGRPKGAKGKATVAWEEKLAEKAAEVARLLTSPFEGDAHMLLMLIYKDSGQLLETRIEAAKAALPYEKPRLQAVQMSGHLAISHEEALERLK